MTTPWASLSQTDEEWEKDLSDVARLTEAATRPQVKAALAAMAVQMTERRRVQASTKASAPAGDKPLSSGDAASSAASAGTTPPPPPAVPSAAAGAGASAGAQPTAAGAGGGAVTTWRSLDKFAWDQSVKYVSVFVTLPGVGTQATVDVNTKFTGTSFELTITGYNGNENYRLVQAPLAKFIDPKRSKHKVKTDRVVVMLAKRDSEPPYGDTWYELRAKKGTKAAPKFDDKKDPSAGIMDMMRDMYEDGDDQMKRTIAEAFSKSRGADGGMGGMGGSMDMDM